MILAKISCVAASRDGTTRSEALKAFITLFRVKRELLVRTATGIFVILLISLMRVPMAEFKVGSPEPENVM